MRGHSGPFGVVHPRLWAASIIALLLAGGAVACSKTPGSAPPEPRPELLALALTEIHYHPLDEGTVDGDEYEFVELKNTGAAALSLAGVAFDQGIQYPIPAGTTLEPGQFLVVASNASAFQDRYGFAPSGEYTGRLNNTGERITLSDVTRHAPIVSVEYRDTAPWPSAADAAGRSLVPVAANLRDDPGRPVHWRMSFAINGSPGRDDPPIAYVNEILAHTDPPEKDSIELFNPNDAPLDISGWFLTDDKAQPAKFQVPPGTILAPQGFGVFTSDDFNADPQSPLAFSLSEHGEQVYLVTDAMGCAIAFCDGFIFGDQENGVGFGRYVNSVGETQLVRLQTPTLGSENAPPAVGPLVIGEIMYNPAPGGDEYVELQNTGALDLPLSEPSLPDHTWKIDGLGFAFPPSITLAPGEIVLLAPSSVAEATFRAEYGVPAEVRIFTTSQDLADYGAVLTLMKAWKPYGSGSDTVLPFILEETIAFTNTTPWPAAANGTGSSLHRKDLSAYGNDPASWEAGPPSPGRVP
jgi:hypothetical protein